MKCFGTPIAVPRGHTECAPPRNPPLAPSPKKCVGFRMDFSYGRAERVAQTNPLHVILGFNPGRPYLFDLTSYVQGTRSAGSAQMSLGIRTALRRGRTECAPSRRPAVASSRGHLGPRPRFLDLKTWRRGGLLTSAHHRLAFPPLQPLQATFPPSSRQSLGRICFGLPLVRVSGYAERVLLRNLPLRIPTAPHKVSLPWFGLKPRVGPCTTIIGAFDSSGRSSHWVSSISEG